MQEVEVLPMSDVKQACESVEGEQRTTFYRSVTGQA